MVTMLEDFISTEGEKNDEASKTRASEDKAASSFKSNIRHRLISRVLGTARAGVNSNNITSSGALEQKFKSARSLKKYYAKQKEKHGRVATTLQQPTIEVPELNNDDYASDNNDNNEKPTQDPSTNAEIDDGSIDESMKENKGENGKRKGLRSQISLITGRGSKVGSLVTLQLNAVTPDQKQQTQTYKRMSSSAPAFTATSSLSNDVSPDQPSPLQQEQKQPQNPVSISKPKFTPTMKPLAPPSQVMQLSPQHRKDVTYSSRPTSDQKTQYNVKDAMPREKGPPKMGKGRAAHSEQQRSRSVRCRGGPLPDASSTLSLDSDIAKEKPSKNKEPINCGPDDLAESIFLCGMCKPPTTHLRHRRVGRLNEGREPKPGENIDYNSYFRDFLETRDMATAAVGRAIQGVQFLSKQGAELHQHLSKTWAAAHGKGGQSGASLDSYIVLVEESLKSMATQGHHQSRGGGTAKEGAKDNHNRCFHYRPNCDFCAETSYSTDEQDYSMSSFNDGDLFESFYTTDSSMDEIVNNSAGGIKDTSFETDDTKLVENKQSSFEQAAGKITAKSNAPFASATALNSSFDATKADLVELMRSKVGELVTMSENRSIRSLNRSAELSRADIDDLLDG